MAEESPLSPRGVAFVIHTLVLHREIIAVSELPLESETVNHSLKTQMKRTVARSTSTLSTDLPAAFHCPDIARPHPQPIIIADINL